MSLMKKVKDAKIKTAKKTSEDYQRLTKYDVVKIGTSKKFIEKGEGDPTIYYVHLDETFQIIYDCNANNQLLAKYCKW